MALDAQFSTLAINTKVDALAALLNSGKFKLYDGAQPANANTAIGAQVLLVTLTFGVTAFGAGVAGVATANAIADGVAVATSTATWFRLTKADGTTVIADGSVGTSGCNLNLTTVAIVSGATVSITAFTLTDLAA